MLSQIQQHTSKAMQNQNQSNTSLRTNTVNANNSQTLMNFKSIIFLYVTKKTKLHGLSPRANYTDRPTATCRRSDCQLFADRGCHVVSVMDPYGRILGFLDRSRYFLSSSSSVVLTSLSGPRSRPITFFFLVVPGIEPGPLDL
jgi:hypothetical protein